MLPCSLACSSTWRWRRCIAPKCQLTLNGLHNFVVHKVEFLLFDVPLRLESFRNFGTILQSVALLSNFTLLLVLWGIASCSLAHCYPFHKLHAAISQRTILLTAKVVSKSPVHERNCDNGVPYWNVHWPNWKTPMTAVGQQNNTKTVAYSSTQFARKEASDNEACRLVVGMETFKAVHVQLRRYRCGRQERTHQPSSA